MSSDFFTLPIIISSCNAVTIGIDTYSFEVKKDQIFYGIKNIPKNSVHLIHFQEHKGETSTRYGYWLSTESKVEKKGHYLKYNDQNEIFEVCYEENLTAYYDKLNEYNNLMVSYPKVTELNGSFNWDLQTKYIDWEYLKRIFGNEQSPFLYIDTSMTSNEENRLLSAKLQINDEKPHLNYITIDFKSKEAIRDEQKMTDFLDKSNFLNTEILPKYFNNNIKKLFSELQTSFLNGIMFGNYGSSLQWHNIVELITQTSHLPGNNTAMLIDDLLSSQIKIIPPEYYEILINIKLWKKVTTESLQKDELAKTNQAFQLIYQQIRYDNGSEPEELNETETNPYDDTDEYYPNIDSDSSNEEGPTIVAGVYHNNI